MAYAVMADVQARIPTQVWEASPDSQPAEEVVESWLEADTRFVEAALRWKYVVPITDGEDLALLRPAVAALTAARVWTVIGGHDGQSSGPAEGSRREALQILAYSGSTGRAALVLPNSELATSGEATTGIPAGSFTDPQAAGNPRRLFSKEMKF